MFSKNRSDAHPGYDVEKLCNFSSDEGPSLVASAELFRDETKAVRDL